MEKQRYCASMMPPRRRRKSEWSGLLMASVITNVSHWTQGGGASHRAAGECDAYTARHLRTVVASTVLSTSIDWVASVTSVSRYYMGVSKKSVSWTSTFVTMVLQDCGRRSGITFLVRTSWTPPHQQKYCHEWPLSSLLKVDIER